MRATTHLDGSLDEEHHDSGCHGVDHFQPSLHRLQGGIDARLAAAVDFIEAIRH